MRMHIHELVPLGDKDSQPSIYMFGQDVLAHQALSAEVFSLSFKL